MSKQRILIVTLFISLLVNAFFIGFAATRMVDAPDGVRKGGILHGVSHRLTRNLDEADRDEVAAALEALDPQFQDLRQKRRDNYQKLRQLLSASEPDREQIDTVLVTMQDQSSELVTVVHQEAVEAILKLPADRRAALPDTDQ